MKDPDIKKVLIVGSGPIVIGQAAEFDYAGTQGCKALKEEGIYTILVNSNPATIMTDPNIADVVYIEPLTVEAVTAIIEKERPDGMLPSLGGQTGLNMALALDEAGVLEKHSVRLLGTSLETIRKAEDRDIFKQTMEGIHEPVANSIIAHSIEEAIDFIQKNGYPVIIRPAFTLGGTGGGIANNDEELNRIVESGLQKSPIHQILLEQSVAGWKEIEYEIIRDAAGNCITVCNMENIDPVGIHTGDSIVIAPSQTLTDKEYQMLRASAMKIVNALGIEGGCNVQYALHPADETYVVIEVNPRVSRSSALASKATGYPIAKVAAKISIGFTLDEIQNPITGKTTAAFEPALDYVVTKIPKWPFDKFKYGKRELGTQMMATGEVMAIDRNFESSFLKAVICLEGNYIGLSLPTVSTLRDEELLEKIQKPTDERIFQIIELLRRGKTIQQMHEKTSIDLWFLDKFRKLVEIEGKLKNERLTADLLHEGEGKGFSDAEISRLTNMEMEQIRFLKQSNNIVPVYKMVDTCAGEFEAETPYYYSTYETEEELRSSDAPKIAVIGSGPIRIGQGIEFDYCCVHAVWGIKDHGYEAIMINNNPETVSTDFDISDYLFFEPLYIDDVMNVIQKQNPIGVFVQFGGQTALNLAHKLEQKGIKILGTPLQSIDLAEDRKKFEGFLQNINIIQPRGKAVTSLEEGIEAAEEIGYPVLVRPSYVIGGQAMEIVYQQEQLIKYLKEAATVSTEFPVLIDEYVMGKEVEVDALCDGEDILIPGIMEHVERTGVHSGDSISIYPPISLSQKMIDELIENTKEIAVALGVRGLLNVQYAVKDERIYVIEVNPRASRTVPILSKVTKVPMVKLAVDIALGKKLVELGYGTGLYPASSKYAVKVPVFSHEKLTELDIALNPEMKSTGEVLGIDVDLSKAVYKGFAGSVSNIPVNGKLYISSSDVCKKEILDVVLAYKQLGFEIFSDGNTYTFLEKNQVKVFLLKDIKDMDIVIILPTRGKNTLTKGFRFRRKAIEYRIPCFTCIDTAKIFIKAIQIKQQQVQISYESM